MKIAFPAQADKGLDSMVFNHFGTANLFVIVDDATGDFEIAVNQDSDHLHGQCQPLKALGGRAVDAVVVGGIGGGALNHLQRNGIRVLRSEEGSVMENLEKLKAGRLTPFLPGLVCSGHGADGDCAHH